MPTTATPSSIAPGVLKLPRSRTQEEARVAARLARHFTSDRWLAEGLSPALDERRTRHLALRDQLGRAIGALTEITVKYDREDRDYRTGLQTAAENGSLDGHVDRRTRPDERAGQRQALTDVIYASAAAMAAFVDETVLVFREAEDDLISDLRERTAQAEVKRAKALALLEEAERDSYFPALLADYVKRNAADAGLMGGQPAPDPEQTPLSLDPQYIRDALSPRHFSDVVPSRKQVPA